MIRIIDPNDVASSYRAEVRAQVQMLGHPLRLVGLLPTDASNSTPSATYASYTRQACEAVGITFDLREVPRLDMEEAIDAANADPSVHGIIVYYPVFGTERDRYLKDLVDERKDIEGLNANWVRRLYHNQRHVESGGKRQKSILPCTPLAIIKLLASAEGERWRGPIPLKGRTAVIFNRSEVVGRPLAAMLANDGADVYSFDIDGPLLVTPARVMETTATRAEALAKADLVITGVPSRAFPLVQAAEIRAGATCLNFSTFRNFAADIGEKAGIFIPRVGPMTVAMALRNTLRLYENYHRQVL